MALHDSDLSLVATPLTPTNDHQPRISTAPQALLNIIVPPGGFRIYWQRPTSQEAGRCPGVLFSNESQPDLTLYPQL